MTAWRLGAAAAVVVMLGACAPKAIGPAGGSDASSAPSTRKITFGGKAQADTSAGPKIKDEELARIPADQLGSVHQLQAQLPPLQDAVKRADLKVDIADKQVAVEEANVGVAQAQTKVADAQKDVAEASGDRSQISDAEQGLRGAQAGVELAQARAELAARKRDQAKIDSMEAHEKLDLQQAKIEQAKVVALRNARDASADHYDPAAFQKRVDDVNDKLRLIANDRDSLQTQLRIAQDKVREAQTAADQHPVRGLDSGDSNQPNQQDSQPQD